jgi:hypothetical protein
LESAMIDQSGPPPSAPPSSLDQCHTPKKRGRPTTFDEPKRQQFCSFLRLGCTIAKAAALAGVSRRGVLHAAAGDPQFAQRIRRARQECETESLENIRAASRKNWRAAAWLLGERGRNIRSATTPGAVRASARALLADRRFRQQVENMVQDMVMDFERQTDAAAALDEPDFDPIDRALALMGPCPLETVTAVYPKKMDLLIADMKQPANRGETVDVRAELALNFPNQDWPEVQEIIRAQPGQKTQTPHRK